MSTVVELPGGTATLKTDDELTNKEVKTLRRSARVATAIANQLTDLGYDEADPDSWKVITKLPDDDYDTLDIFQRTCVIVRLRDWNVDGVDRPTDADSVDDLPRPVFVPLTVAAADIKLSDDFSVDGAVDPKAPTGDSVSSEPPLVEETS
jgi:hypothetical protein